MRCPKISVVGKSLKQTVLKDHFCSSVFQKQTTLEVSLLVITRIVKPEPKTFRWWSWSLKFGFSVSQRYFVGQASYTNNTNILSDFLDQIVPELEQKASRCLSRSQKYSCPELEPKFEYRLHSPRYYQCCQISVRFIAKLPKNISQK